MFGNISTFVPAPALPLADAMIAPLAIILLCVAAGIGTLLLLPNRKFDARRNLGGVLLTLAGLALVSLIIHVVDGGRVSITGIYFWIFAAIALCGAIRVITHPRPVYSALYFVLTVFATAGLFVLMYAEFMAAALVLIYAGAILVTYVFVIMLAASAQSENDNALRGLAECDISSRDPFIACCVGFALMGVLLFLIFDKMQAPPVSQGSMMAAGVERIHGTTQSVGRYLFENQLVSFELAGLILTVSMVGAILIARRRVLTPADAFEPSTETINAAMTPIDDNPRSIPVYGTTNPRQKAFPET